MKSFMQLYKIEFKSSLTGRKLAQTGNPGMVGNGRDGGAIVQSYLQTTLLLLFIEPRYFYLL